MNDLKWNLFSCLSEFEKLMQSRHIAHGFNNLLTPMSMNVSMIKNYISEGKIEKALDRIEKLEPTLNRFQASAAELLATTSIENWERQTLTKNHLETLIKATQGYTNADIRIINIIMEDEINTLQLIPEYLAIFVFIYLQMSMQSWGHVLEVSVHKAGPNHTSIRLASPDHGKMTEDSDTLTSIEVQFQRLSKVLSATRKGYQVNTLDPEKRYWEMLIDNSKWVK